MRRAWAVGIAVAIAGCGKGGDGETPGDPRGALAPIVVCGASDDAARDDAVFRGLIGSRWQAGYCDPEGAPTWGCHRLDLAADGTFRWELPPDAGGGQRAGGWNFLARGEGRGVVCLEDGSVLGFELNEPPPGTEQPVLELGAQSFLGVEPVGASGSRAALPAVRSEGLFEALSRDGWRKTNTFDLELMPDELLLSDDGTFHASYREGACEHDGRWGLLEGRLVSASEQNQCDVRGGYPQPARLTSMDERPSLVDGMLRFLSGATYRAASAPDDGTQLFGFASYGGDERLEIRGVFAGELSAGQPTDIHFRFANEGASPQWMGRVRVRLQRLGQYGYPEGMPETLAERDYEQKTIPAGVALEDVVSIVPTEAGSYLLDLDVSSSTLRHSFPNGRTYRVTVR